MLNSETTNEGHNCESNTRRRTHVRQQLGMYTSGTQSFHCPEYNDCKRSSSNKVGNKSLFASRLIHKPRIHPYGWRSTQFLCNKTLFSLKREYYHGIFQMIILRHFPNLHKVLANTGKEALEKMRYQKWSYFKRILRILMTEIKLKSKTETKKHSSEELI